MFDEKNIVQSSKSGWVEVICGSMFSGKTEELIRRLKRAEFAKQSIKIFKPALDTRYDKTKIVSHNATAFDSISVAKASEILLLYENAQVVGIDEAQFFDLDIINVCNALANHGTRVIVAGLDMNFQGKPFGPMPFLLAIAEYVTKVRAICVKTGQLATYSHRIAPNEDIVMLGEKQAYEPLSREVFWDILEQEKHYKEHMKRQKNDGH